MKRFQFSLVLMICGSIILAGGIIGGGAEVSGINVNANFPYSIADSAVGMIFIVIGAFVFMSGLFSAIGDMNKNKI